MLWKFNSKLNLYQIQCDVEVPDLKFTMNGVDYTVPGEELVLLEESENICFFAVAKMNYAAASGGDTLDAQVSGKLSDLIPGDDGPVPFNLIGNTWLVGDTFLRQYYTIYDYENEKMGFAQLKD